MTGCDTKQDIRPVALIGMRGCGKSVVGRELATLLGGECVDTDELIIQEAGRAIAAIFTEEGEAGFRRRERHAVKLVTETAPLVISVGGGAILNDGNRRLLKRAATIVWLTAPVEVLWERISADTGSGESRPPLTDFTGQKEIEHLLAKRQRHYERAAKFIIDTAGKTPREIAQAIAQQVKPSSDG